MQYPEGIGLRGAAQPSVFAYALVWYNLCIYIHRVHFAVPADSGNNDNDKMTI